MLIGRLMAGSLSLARLVRRSAEVPDWIVAECRAIAGQLGCSAVRVRRSTEVPTPFLTGVWHPCSCCRTSRARDVKPGKRICAVAAHELTHARNHDLFWNLAANLASIVLWFHPLAWRIRAVHASACDAVCDAVAADTIGDVASYGRTLARLTLQRRRSAGANPGAGHGACLRRPPPPRRLESQGLPSAISPNRILPALLAAGVLLYSSEASASLALSRPWLSRPAEPKAPRRNPTRKKPAG